VWNRQASGYHRFFSQFTIPVAHPLLDAARVTAGSTVLDAVADPGYAARAARARGARVVAADLSAARGRTHENRRSRLAVRVTDPRRLAFTPGVGPLPAWGPGLAPAGRDPTLSGPPLSAW